MNIKNMYVNNNKNNACYEMYMNTVSCRHFAFCLHDSFYLNSIFKNIKEDEPIT